MKKVTNFFSNVGFEISYFFMELFEEIGEFLGGILYSLGILFRAVFVVGGSLAIIAGGFFGILWVIAQLVKLF